MFTVETSNQSKEHTQDIDHSEIIASNVSLPFICKVYKKKNTLKNKCGILKKQSIIWQSTNNPQNYCIEPKFPSLLPHKKYLAAVHGDKEVKS